MFVHATNKIFHRVKIPWYVLSIDRFNSQSRENIFRLARAMTGVSSTMVNFTVYDFLRRADKISLLQSIKTENQNSINGNSIRFPNHHKHMKNNDGAVGLTSSNDLIQRHDIERVVNEAFIASRALVEPLISEGDDDDQYEDKQTDEINSDDDQETECIAELVLDCSDASFNGMRVKETIETPKSFTYFEVRRRNDTKNVFIHKQTAAWLLSNEKTSLSSDRLKRVTQR